jgi:rubrerythrin
MTKSEIKTAKKLQNKMKKTEKDVVYYCDVCGCEVVGSKPGKGPIICCNETMCYD